jgi:bifunctional non-homologous end joining protein LigD
LLGHAQERAMPSSNVSESSHRVIATQFGAWIVLREMPAKAVVLDGEIVASDADGRPNFARLHVRWTRPGAIHLWAFDLLALNGQDLCPHALVKRQARLHALLERFGCPAVSLSETFRDGVALLRAAEEHRLEGVVSKRRDAPIDRVTAGTGGR